MSRPPTDPIPNFAAGVPCDACEGTVLPVIAQDATSGRVLMMAWMNEAAWLETLATGQAVYFSRSRGTLWRKGETSGHRQRVREIRVDCDADTILLKVDQTGAACHEGFESCFFRQVDADGHAHTTESRLVDPSTVYR
ncbi:MAG: phosphoribosyl-AMP cyclohydrolase [Planctomycetota bacterium]